MQCDAHSSSAVAATLASQIGFAIRNVRKIYKGQSCPQAIEQALAAFGFGLQSLRHDLSCEDVHEPVVPVLVPLSLAETTLRNVQSWAMHQDDVNVVGHPVHFASVAALAAHQVAQRDPAATSDRLLVHRKAARQRHNVKPAVAPPSFVCREDPRQSSYPSASPSGPAALALGHSVPVMLARRCAIRRAADVERARSYVESSEPGDEHQMLRLETKIDSIKIMVADLAERSVAANSVVDLQSQTADSFSHDLADTIQSVEVQARVGSSSYSEELLHDTSYDHACSIPKEVERRVLLFSSQDEADLVCASEAFESRLFSGRYEQFVAAILRLLYRQVNAGKLLSIQSMLDARAKKALNRLVIDVANKYHINLAGSFRPYVFGDFFAKLGRDQHGA